MNGVWIDGEQDHNWVIVQDNGEPLRFPSGELVIYGGVQDYENDMIEGDTAMTLGQYAESIGVHWRTLIQ